MRGLDINITKAKLVSFSVQAKESEPVVSAEIALITEGGKVITTYSVGSDSWRNDKLEIPLEAYPLLGELVHILEAVTVKHCRDSQRALPASQDPSF